MKKNTSILSIPLSILIDKSRINEGRTMTEMLEAGTPEQHWSLARTSDITALWASALGQEDPPATIRSHPSLIYRPPRIISQAASSLPTGMVLSDLQSFFLPLPLVPNTLPGLCQSWSRQECSRTGRASPEHPHHSPWRHQVTDQSLVASRAFASFICTHFKRLENSVLFKD